MKEIKIVLNNDPETFRGNEFSIYIDDVELEHIKSFSLDAVKPDPDDDSVDLDQIITYTVDFSAKYFEDKINDKTESSEGLCESTNAYDDFVSELKNGKGFEKFIQSITTTQFTKKTGKDSGEWQQNA